ncbi:hypothetical protein PCANC_06008 [Puccinia coronata f. sp. avenae]|uniref:Presequence translocated-associated motor subunit PAM17 n=1 Tax=Puccinia coronata f. sp. avenae TaxID=200324 RepID=A0A2N5RUP0_9BASI|nr:hypothetical protein PCASD_25763 [Puccinia coronata f. sp. avenae]PLW53438.1 hypothetical protein PCANC_06008 [Puccinia coronata f. sp. avenae]
MFCVVRQATYFEPLPSLNRPPAMLTRLTWSEYLALRKQQRRYALWATVPITTLGLTLGVNYFATIEAAPTDLIMGIEAPYVYGLATLGCGFLGYLVGPSVGHAFFRLRVSTPTLRAIQERNAQFYQHIRRHRVDPAQSILNNPLPDWHGERIGSLQQYRKWLRDQAAYRRKASQHNMLLSDKDLGGPGKDLL